MCIRDSDYPFSVIYHNREYTTRSVPADIYSLWKDEHQFIMGRVSPIIGHGTMELVTGRNYRGEKVDFTDTIKELMTMWLRCV